MTEATVDKRRLIDLAEDLEWSSRCFTDYIRILREIAGIPTCPSCGQAVKAQEVKA